MQGYENATIANTAVTYSGDWGRFQSVAIWTEDIGGSAILTFTGVGITVYGFQTYDVVDGNAKSTFTIDHGIVSFVKTSGDTWCVLCPEELDQPPGVLFTSPTLSNDMHTLNFTAKEEGWIGLDHFVVSVPQASSSEPGYSVPSASEPSQWSSTASSSGPMTKYSAATPTHSEGERPCISEPASIASVVIGALVATSLLTALLWHLVLRRYRTKKDPVIPHTFSTASQPAAVDCAPESEANPILRGVSTRSIPRDVRSGEPTVERAADLKRTSAPARVSRWSRTRESSEAALEYNGDNVPLASSQPHVHREREMAHRAQPDSQETSEGQRDGTDSNHRPQLLDYADGDSVVSSVPPPYTE
ncbi:hypothetical protein OH76DRAFT_1400571 [Lentinus brumalis]|uniref:Uncharacterized protein n=1 Tax=Lentinus brumalis TaxID=2498619 RepID=A0A371DI89_9APHY|nr:hypothetical protein OH76DRAFT_1400571 [Polyporus brumalis]